jgi:flagellar basal body rod protein FlgG
MIQGIYRSAATMMTEILRQDIHSHNLANASTTGFKRTLGRVVNGGDPTQEAWVASSVDLSPGSLETTGSPLDLALGNSGFFVVQGATGPQYTRDGHFTRDAQGFLATMDGRRVLGTRGPIQLGNGAAEVSADGWISVGGQKVDRLQVVDYKPGDVLSHDVASTLKAAQAPRPLDTFTIAQGVLENSNVSPMTELGSIRSGYRIYEANARAVEQVDRSLQKLIEGATA